MAAKKKKEGLPKPLFTLIKWYPDNTYTSGIPLDWVRGYDIEEFHRTKEIDSEETYVIEWRDRKKEPKGGWLCYDGYVMAISSSTGHRNDNPIRVKEPARPGQSSTMDDVAVAIQDTNKNITELRKRLENLENNTRPNLSHRLSPASHSACSASGSSSQLIPPSTHESSYARPLSLQEVEIGRPGSNVCFTVDQWDCASEKRTFTAMTVSLVLALFDEEVLLNSNYKGGKSRINKDAVTYNALDPGILKAIECTTN